MPSVQILPKVGENDRREWKCSDAVTDADVGKPVTLDSTNTQVTLCSDGDAVYGWIDSIEQGTDGGLIVVTVVESGTVRATASGSVAIGDKIEAGANAAAGTKPTSWGVVSTHTVDDTTTTTIVSTTFAKNWIALTGAGDGEDIVVKSV